MGMFSKKETIVVLRSEEQRDEYIDKLQKAHVEYDQVGESNRTPY